MNVFNNGLHGLLVFIYYEGGDLPPLTPDPSQYAGGDGH